MEFLFTPITFISIGEVVVKMHIFELTAMILVMLQIWLYGRLSVWGPIWGAVGAVMWITMGWMATPTMFGLIILNIIILYLQALNYYKWSRKDDADGAAPAAEAEKA